MSGFRAVVPTLAGQGPGPEFAFPSSKGSGSQLLQFVGRQSGGEGPGCSRGSFRALGAAGPAPAA